MRKELSRGQMFMRSVFALFAVTLIGACKDLPFGKPDEGAFSGFFRENTLQEVRAHSHPFDSDDLKKGWIYQVEWEDSRPLGQLILKPLKDGSIELSFPERGVKEVVFAPVSEDRISGEGCFHSRMDGMLCLSSGSLELDLSAFSMSLVSAKSAVLPQFETPQVYSMEDLVQKGMLQSLDSRIQAERIFQSRVRAKQAYLSLLPSLNLWSGMRLANLNEFNGIIMLAGTLTPFLFPNRWIRAAESVHLSRADQYGAIVLRANAGVMLETLSLSHLRNQSYLSKLTEQLMLIRPIRDEMVNREKLGLVEEGASEELSLLVLELENSVDSLAQSLPIERALISQALGFMNPMAISQVEELRSPVAPIDWTEDQVTRLREVVLGKAFEVRQLDALIRAARLEKIAQYFVWMDPSGEGTAQLGFNLPYSFKVSESRIRELELVRERIQTQLLYQLEESIRRGKIEGSLVERLQSAIKLHEGRFDRLNAKIKLGMNVPLEELVRTIQGWVRAEMDLVRADFQSRAYISMLERYQYTGIYAQAEVDHERAKE